MRVQGLGFEALDFRFEGIECAVGGLRHTVSGLKVSFFRIGG